MSKKISLIILAVVLVLAIVIPSSKVYAANKEILTSEVIEENGVITVSGYVENGMLAVAVQVFDKDNNLVALETGEVKTNNTFKVEIELPTGDYIVKIADYDGGNVETRNVSEIKKIEEVNITIEEPVIGQEIKVLDIEEGDDVYQAPNSKPTVKEEEGANYTVDLAFWNCGTTASLTDGQNVRGYFEGIFEDGKDYYALLNLHANNGYIFDENLKVKVNGEDAAEMLTTSKGTTVGFIAKLKAKVKDEGKEDEATEENTTEETTNEETKTENYTPKTGDNIGIFVAIFVISTLGVITLVVLNKKGTAGKRSKKK